MVVSRSTLRKMRVIGAALFAGLMVTAVSASPVQAAGQSAKKPGGIYAGMDQCPLKSKELKDPSNLQVGCVVSVTNSGSVTIGTTTVPLTKPITLQFGVVWPKSAPVVTFPDGSSANVYSTVSAADGKTLKADALEVPIPNIANLIPGVTSVFAVVELAGPITSFVPLALGENTPVFVMPVKLHLLNLLFGLNCYIGSDSTPIYMSPTTGTTSPPAPNKPITGDPGVIGVQPDPNGFQSVVASFAGARLVDNSLSVPRANGCGILNALDPIINSVFGIPSAAGHNAVIFSDTNTSLAIDGSLTDLTQALAASSK
jgi:hypothetical protein